MFRFEGCEALSELDICIGTSQYTHIKNFLINTLVLLFIQFIYKYRRTDFVSDIPFFIQFLKRTLLDIFVLKKHMLVLFSRIIRQNEETSELAQIGEDEGF